MCVGFGKAVGGLIDRVQFPLVKDACLFGACITQLVGLQRTLSSFHDGFMD